MTERIAILGWGSLLWDLDDLAPKVAGSWAMRAGPRLPMEFSRISAKRKLGLVLCLDPATGAPCATHAIASIRTGIGAARADLAARERAPTSRIGWADPSGEGESRLPELLPHIGAWCRAAGWAGAVWTDLEPNFRETTGRTFTVPEGLGYLRGLAGESLAEAHRYIRNAPLATRTPLRRALARDTWWRGLSRPHGALGRADIR
ncbi:hypothetical protein [Rhodobacteraceae bacterium DSL-40]|uniref:hypothetical protein n=1 Tax=Amaricoccus sp. B4 TaxID=3368557 RepID=UPI000DAE5426